MEINETANTINSFFETYQKENESWNPTEIRVLPSGDNYKGIEIRFHFEEGVADEKVKELKESAMAALREAHPDIEKHFELDVRAESL